MRFTSWRDDDRKRFRPCGKENPLFEDDDAPMAQRHAHINDRVAISESQRRFRWPHGGRPDDRTGLSEPGL